MAIDNKHHHDELIRDGYHYVPKFLKFEDITKAKLILEEKVGKLECVAVIPLREVPEIWYKTCLFVDSQNLYALYYKLEERK